jgi:hypothetical protein
MRLRPLFAAAAAMLLLGFAPAQGQDKPPEKPTFSNYLLQGYDIIHTEGGGGQFLFFLLRKDRTVVWCSVLLQSGETSSCRTLK